MVLDDTYELVDAMWAALYCLEPAEFARFIDLAAQETTTLVATGGVHPFTDVDDLEYLVPLPFIRAMAGARFSESDEVGLPPEPLGSFLREGARACRVIAASDEEGSDLLGRLARRGIDALRCCDDDADQIVWVIFHSYLRVLLGVPRMPDDEEQLVRKLFDSALRRTIASATHPAADQPSEVGEAADDTDDEDVADFLVTQAERFTNLVDEVAQELTAFAVFDAMFDASGGAAPDSDVASSVRILWNMMHVHVEGLLEALESRGRTEIDLDEMARLALLMSLGTADRAALDLLDPDEADAWTDQMVGALDQLTTTVFGGRVDVDEERSRRVLTKIRDHDVRQRAGDEMLAILEKMDRPEAAASLRARFDDDGLVGWLTGVAALFAGSAAGGDTGRWFQMACCGVILARRADPDARGALRPFAVNAEVSTVGRGGPVATDYVSVITSMWVAMGDLSAHGFGAFCGRAIVEIATCVRDIGIAPETDDDLKLHLPMAFAVAMAAVAESPPVSDPLPPEPIAGFWRDGAEACRRWVTRSAAGGTELPTLLGERGARAVAGCDGQETAVMWATFRSYLEVLFGVEQLSESHKQAAMAVFDSTLRVAGI